MYRLFPHHVLFSISIHVNNIYLSHIKITLFYVPKKRDMGIHISFLILPCVSNEHIVTVKLVIRYHTFE